MECPLTSSDTGPGDGVASPLPFGGYPLRHSLNLNSVARSGARGVRAQKRGSKTMRAKKSWIALICILACGTMVHSQSSTNILTQKDFDHFIAFYYQSPHPELIPAAISYMGKAGIPENEDHYAPFLGFYAEVFASNKEMMPQWREKIGLTSGKTKDLLETAMNLASDPENMLKADANIEQPSFNDLCWGAFFASGKEVYLAALVKRLEFLSERTLLMRYVTAGSAQWSLASNAQQHPRVKEYLEKALESAQPEMKKAIRDTLEVNPDLFQERMVGVVKEQHEKKVW
jgi:hypothetical protein